MTNVSSHSTPAKVIPITNYKTFDKQDLRCQNCNKLLAKANEWKTFGIEIKCPRCGSLENF